MRACPRESTCAGDGVSRSRCVTCCTRRQLIESGEACFVWPLCPGSSLPISHNRLREIGAPPLALQAFPPEALHTAPRVRGSLPSPDFCDIDCLFWFLSYFLVSISVSLLFLLVLNVWHRPQFTNSETFIILIFKIAPFALYSGSHFAREWKLNCGELRVISDPSAVLVSPSPGVLMLRGGVEGARIRLALSLLWHSHTGTPWGFCHFCQVPVLSNVCHHSGLLGPPELLSELARSLFSVTSVLLWDTRETASYSRHRRRSRETVTCDWAICLVTCHPAFASPGTHAWRGGTPPLFCPLSGMFMGNNSS